MRPRAPRLCHCAPPHQPPHPWPHFAFTSRLRAGLATHAARPSPPSLLLSDHATKRPPDAACRAPPPLSSGTPAPTSASPRSLLPPSRAASPRSSLAHERSLGLRAYLRAPTSTVEGARSAQRLSGPDQAYSASNPRMLLPPSVWARLCRLLGRSAGLTDPTPPPSAPPHADGAAQGSEHPGPAQHVGLPYRRL